MGRMRILDLTLPTPAENLALDEALLEEAEAAAEPLETLRFWEPAENMAVVGRSSYVDNEVHQDACRELGISVFRRISGGAAIVTGPGCLMYALVLSYENNPSLIVVKRAHAFVLETLANALSKILPSTDQPSVGARRGAGGEGPVNEGVHYCGTSDLAIQNTGKASGTQSIKGTGKDSGTQSIKGAGKDSGTQSIKGTGIASGTQLQTLGNLKFSGNSMRCRKRNLLYHGTILYNFPLELISRCLKIPPRMPDYRNSRDHGAFIANLPVPADAIKKALISAWNAVEPLAEWPRELTSRLAAEKYANPQWNELL
jgi:lipoate---protein ligase